MAYKYAEYTRESGQYENFDIILYQDILDFLTDNEELRALGQQWTLLDRQSVIGADPNDSYDYASLMAPGLDGQDNIYINLCHYRRITSDTYSIRIAGATGYDPTYVTLPDKQPGASMASSYGSYTLRMPIQQTSLRYWLVASGRRFILVLNQGTRYTTLHGGFILPFAFPSQYPYPLLVGANNSTTDKYQTPPLSNYIYVNNKVTSPGGLLHLPAGGWINGPEHADNQRYMTNRYTCWPFDKGTGLFMAHDSSLSLANMVPAQITGGSEPVFAILPIHILSRGIYNGKINNGIFGSFDGLYFANKFVADAGDTFKIGETQYLMFQMETSNANAHHFLLKLE